MTSATSVSQRAILAGATCLLILSGMMAGHAWPLWTGRVVTMKVIPADPRDLFRGEYVHLTTVANELYRPGAAAQGTSWSYARPLDGVFERSRPGSIVYVQLSAVHSGDYVPVSVSLEAQPGALNLRGRVRYPAAGALSVDYGVDAFYMQEGKGRKVEEAIRQRRNVQIQIAIASSGQARIKTLLIDGIPVDRF